MKQKLLAILMILPFLTFGQDCNCKSNFDWIKKTFEENDAGFQYIVDKKGEQAYEVHNLIFIEQIKKVTDINECHKLLNEWLRFFRKGHIGVQYLGSSEENSSKNASNDKKTNEQFKDWETYSVNTEKFKKYLDRKTEHNYEGIWKSGPYKICIKEDDNNFIGFIIESETETWKKEQVKLKISIEENKVNSIYYMLDHSAVESNEVLLTGNNHLQIGDIQLTRIYPKVENEPLYNLHFKMLDANLPFIEQLNETTLYFRIPSFMMYEKQAIDSVIAINRKEILKTKNLIIDIRYGTGGGNRSYYEILPFLYTNPIRTPAVEYLSTPLNNQRWLDLINNTGIALEMKAKFSEEDKKEFKEHYDTLSNHIGEFVNLGSSSVYVTTYDTIYPYPKNVGIIIHDKNGSTDEQFLLAAKQSKKVKLFGKTTRGSLDFSNMNRIKSPCGDFALSYTLSKSYRIPDMAIDDKGIQPDYYIDREIPEYEWINFVSKILNE